MLASIYPALHPALLPAWPHWKSLYEWSWMQSSVAPEQELHCKTIPCTAAGANSSPYSAGFVYKCIVCTTSLKQQARKREQRERCYADPECMQDVQFSALDYAQEISLSLHDPISARSREGGRKENSEERVSRSKQSPRHVEHPVNHLASYHTLLDTRLSLDSPRQ